MNEADGGPYNITDLARMLRMPRSTVYRHLKGGQPTRDSLRIYSKVLGVKEEELARLAGYAVPSNDELSNEIHALSAEVANLSPEAIEAVWRVVMALRAAESQNRSRAM